MGNARITIDTHSLLWYVDKDQNRELTPRALQVIIQAEEKGIIYVPAIVLMETLHLLERGRFRFLDRQGEDMKKIFEWFISLLEQSENYQIVPMDANLMRATVPFKGLEIHDRLIVATAIITNSVLVSKDREIRATGLDIVWSSDV